MTYAPVNGLQLYYEVHGSTVHGGEVHGGTAHGGTAHASTAHASGRPLVLLHGGLLTIDLSFGPLLEPLAAGRPVIAVELQGHGRTALTDRPMTIEALASDVVGLLDHLGIEQADVFGFSLGGLVAYAVALSAPARVGKLVVASADALRPPGRESVPLTEDRMPTAADFEQMRAAYLAASPEPARFEESAAKTSTLVHEIPGWADELGKLQAPTLLVFGDRDFSPLTDITELFQALPDAQLAVLPGTTHMNVVQRPAQLLALITPFLDGR